MAHDVFISYSSHDKPVADAVCSALENASLRCWIAPRDVQPGRSFAGEITRAIQQSTVMVMIFSAHANESEQVLREVQLAVEAKLHIIQFRIGETLLNDDLKYYLSTPHWLDALTPPLQAHLTRLTAAISSLTGTDESRLKANQRSESPAVCSSQPALRGERGKKDWMIVAAAVILIGVFGVTAYLYRDYRRRAVTLAQARKPTGEATSPKLSSPIDDPAAAPLSGASPSVPMPSQALENSLGMRFVPVPGTNALFSVWDTRVQDYDAFAKATGHRIENVPFEQGPTHPVANVSWGDAKAFCQWLTEKERREGRLSPGQEYRLPTDREWSAAAGLSNESDGTPMDKDGKIKDIFPWGTQWPPPKGSGNFASALQVDEYPFTSPVGTFPANEYGLYDLGGNVWQWCEDWSDDSRFSRVLRGSTWFNDDPQQMLSSDRFICPPSTHYDGGYFGFRCVLGTTLSVK
ncbi:MAG: SUMF1/EgtB/PvdO family nonheme iron enzyme [Verrucomicrobiota bacterium]|nr:SUMF1/EgtB/PvdO family nonheme iron enzyme [Verrucomicrobiota bacterium]